MSDEKVIICCPDMCNAAGMRSAAGICRGGRNGYS